LVTRGISERDGKGREGKRRSILEGRDEINASVE
jgi:hypothetical protein